MKKTSKWVLALFLGSSHSIKLQKLPWADNDWFDRNDAEMNKWTERYSEARQGILITDAERQAKADK
jgi:hypothetical protein